MHEMGIAMQIVEIAQASIPKELAGRRVAAVNLKVGKLSAVVSHSLRFCFDVVTRDTPLNGAALNIEEVDIQAVCDACEQTFVISEPVFSCPYCKSGDIRLTTGRELDISSIELEDDMEDDVEMGEKENNP